MLFSSVTFLFAFLPVTLILYYISPRKMKNIILLVMSLLFYGWGEPKYIILMMLSVVVGYFLGLFADKQKKAGNIKKARLAVVGTVVFNIGMLCYFKYTDFFIGNVNSLFGTQIPVLNLVLPLGISFYSFQIMSYTIDVYRGDAKPQKNILDLAMYLALFPQLIAGPIVRYQTIADQIVERKETFDTFSEGITRFVLGLAKKVLLANTIGEVFTTLSTIGDDRNSVALSWLCSFAFTFQIYFDFSGYSDMAIGLGKMFGFEFLENFNYPYISKSITEFWRRWHISLSTWFKDYVYIPLGGSKKGKAKTIRNIFIVWFLTGFWHGAAWNFIIWGLYFFVLLMIEKNGLLKLLEKTPKWISHVYTLFFVNISWVIFSYDKLPDLGNALKNMFGLNGLAFWNTATSYYYYSYGIILLILCVAATPFPKWIVNKIYEKATGGVGSKVLHFVAEPAVILILMLMVTACLASDSFNPFLYFRF